MNIIDIGTIVVLILALIVGLARGFGKSLKTFTKGVFGIIISVFVCISFGGMIANIEYVSNFIAKINQSIANASEFLGNLKLGIWVYYVVLFFIIQILRVLVVKVLVDLFEKENAVMKFINKFLGAAFSPAAVCMFLLLVLAVFKVFDNLTFVQNILTKIDGSFIQTVYENNPITLTL